jgi:type III secretion YscU/HrpY family protein
MDGEKTEEPTPRKLNKARERGEVFKSADVIHTAQFIALLILLCVAVVLYLPRLRELFDVWPVLWAQLPREIAGTPPEQAARAALSHGLHVMLLALWPLLLIPLVIGLGAAWFQVRGVFSLQPLTPNFERFNPGSNLKRLFASRNLIELVKTLVKVVFIGMTVWVTVRGVIPQSLEAVAGATPAAIASLLGRSLFAMALACLALYIFMSGVDYGHQFYEYMKQQRMTKDEVKREYKEIEGDPYIKGQRRAIGMQMALEEPSTNLSKAKVVVTNPTHLSVAIAYDPQFGGLPSVVAKGSDATAMAIRHQARRLGIPIVENKPLARRLYQRVNRGAFITADMFAEVARLLAAVPRTHRSRSDDWGRV